MIVDRRSYSGLSDLTGLASMPGPLSRNGLEDIVLLTVSYEPGKFLAQRSDP